MANLSRLTAFLFLIIAGCPTSKSNQEAEKSSIASCSTIKKLDRAQRLVCRLLHHQDAAQRKAAAESLGELGRSGPSARVIMNNKADPDRAAVAIPALIKALRDKDTEVRQAAAHALERMGQRAAAAVPALVDALDNNPELSPFVANALGAIGTKASAAIPSLAAKMREKNPRQQYLYAWTLAQIGPKSLPPLTKALKDRDATLQKLAADALGRMGLGAEPALSDLALLVGHKNESLRVSALSAFASICSTGMGMFKKVGLCDKDRVDRLKPVIEKGLEDGSPSVLNAAARSVGALGIVDAAMIPALTKILAEHPDKEGRRNAAESIGWMGPEALSSVPALKNALSDPDEHVRTYAAWALGRIGSQARASVDALLRRAKASTDQEREVAIDAIGKIGGGAASAFPYVLELFKGKDERLSRLAAAVLPRISPKGTPVLVQGLGSRDARVRADCAWALGSLGQKAEGVSAALVKSLNDPQDSVRYAAAQALGEIGASSSIPALQESLKDSDTGVKTAVIDALGKMGRRAASARAMIEPLEKSDDEQVREAAKRALKLIPGR